MREKRVQVRRRVRVHESHVWGLLCGCDAHIAKSNAHARAEKRAVVMQQTSTARHSVVGALHSAVWNDDARPLCAVVLVACARAALTRTCDQSSARARRVECANVRR